LVYKTEIISKRVGDFERARGSLLPIRERGKGRIVNILPENQVNDMKQMINDTPRSVHRHIRAAMTDSEEKYRLLTQMTKDFIMTLNLDGQFTDVNHAMIKAIGYDKEEFLNMRLSDVVSPEYIPIIAEHLRKRDRQDQKETYDEIEFVGKTGKRIRVELSAGLVLRNNKPAAILANARNIDERKRAEKALHDSEIRYRSFFESVGQGYFEVDLKGKLVFFNDSLCEIIRCSRGELSKMSHREYLDQENTKNICRIFRKVCRTGKPEIGVIGEVTRRNGTIRQIGTSVSLMKSSEGRPVGFRGMVRDISDRKILEGQLAQAKKLESIGQLAAGVAHEINTPTQYVSDNAHFLEDAFSDIDHLLMKYEMLFNAAKTGATTDNIIKQLESAIEKADIDYLREEIPLAIRQSLEGLDRVSEIVQAMKTFSHPGTKDKTPIDINQAIQSTITVARNEWKYVADMKTDLDPALPPVPCMPGEFNQVILNMITNAAHAISDQTNNGSTEKGTIHISTRSNTQWAEIRITDTGTGIPQEMTTKIFDPFFTTKGVGSGTGQGLAISHNIIVKKLNGFITFETEVGKGTTFIIRIPMADQNE
jgi:PAS domain S-box-containing protein